MLKSGPSEFCLILENTYSHDFKDLLLCLIFCSRSFIDRSNLSIPVPFLYVYLINLAIRQSSDLTLLYPQATVSEDFLSISVRGNSLSLYTLPNLKIGGHHGRFILVFCQIHRCFGHSSFLQEILHLNGRYCQAMNYKSGSVFEFENTCFDLSNSDFYFKVLTITKTMPVRLYKIKVHKLIQPF